MKVRGNNILLLIIETFKDKRKMYSYMFLCVLSLKWKYVMNCGTTLTQPNGEIASPGYPAGIASVDRYCIDTIQLSVGKRIHIKWVTFHVPGNLPQCTVNFVRIARCTEPFRYLVRYCGDITPNDIYSSNNCVRIDFRSTGTNATFKIQYETLDTSRSLFPTANAFSIKNYKDTMNIYTPNWPLTYSGLVPLSGIKTRVIPKPYRKMKIVFMGIDLYTPQQSNRLCWEARNDVLQFRGMTTDGSWHEYNYCGKQKSFVKSYDRYYKYVDFILKPGTAHVHNHTGLLLGIVFYEVPLAEYDDDDDEGGKLIAGIVVPIIVVLIVLYCVNKRATESGGCRAMMHKTREDWSTGGDVVQPHQMFPTGAYTLPGPPPYPPPSYGVITYGQGDGSEPYAKPLPPPAHFVPPTSNMPPSTSGTAPPPYADTSYINPPGYDASYQPVDSSLPPVYNAGR